MASNLNGSDYVYRKTGLSGMVTFEKLWEGALWPYAEGRRRCAQRQCRRR